MLGLGLCGAEKEVPLVVGFLKDKDPLVLDAAILSLGFISSTQSVQALAALHNHKRESVRNAAALCLGWIDSALARQELERFLKDEDPWVRVAAAVAATSFDRPRAKKMLLSLAGSGDEDAAAYATIALCVFPNDRDVVAAALRNSASENNSIRMNAASTLGFLRDPATVKRLVALLGDGEEFIRAEAIRSLAEFSTQEARAALVKTLRQDEASFVRAKAAINLHNFDDVTVLDALVRGLRDPDDEVRSDSMLALGKVASLVEGKQQKVVKAAVTAALEKEKYVTVEKAGELAAKALENGAASPALMAQIGERTERVGGRIEDELARLLYFTTLRVMEIGLDTNAPFQTMVTTYYTTCGGMHAPVKYERLTPFISTIGHATRDLKTWTGQDQYFDKKLERKTGETSAGGAKDREPGAR